MKKIIIAGGGISGLITAIQLANAGIETILIEKKIFPFHRVCGEYISNEVIPFLERLGLFPESFSPSSISRLQLTSVNGKSAELKLKSGGFGISRFTFDSFLHRKGIEAGVKFALDSQITRIRFEAGQFVVQTNKESLIGDLVIGAFGKRSSIDTNLGRSFIKKRSPYVGVKYHIQWDHPADLISLHNFKNGYCGVSCIEDGKVNLCYLSHHENLRKHVSLHILEKEVLYRNPFLRSIFNEAKFLFEKPEVISEISFETKEPVYNHVLMTGDAAGMITPLCGNGMAMAIQSSKIAVPLVIRFCQDEHYDREELERDYSSHWKNAFEKRLWSGRQIQRLFGSEWSSNALVNIARYSHPIASWLVEQTHGDPF